MVTKILVGPPGTGKTTRLMEILEEELKTVPSTRIAFVTFTREGAKQGITRAMEKTGLPKDSFPFFRTLHSLAFKQAEVSKNDLMDFNEYRELSKALGMTFIGHYSEELKHDDDRYLGLFELYRNNPIIDPVSGSCVIQTNSAGFMFRDRMIFLDSTIYARSSTSSTVFNAVCLEYNIRPFC